MFLFSCRKKPSQELYKVTYHQLQADTALKSIIFSNGYYLCLQGNGKIAAFDAAYKRNQAIEDSLNIFPISYFYRWRDTTFLVKDHGEQFRLDSNYYFTSNFVIKTKRFEIFMSETPGPTLLGRFFVRNLSQQARGRRRHGFLL